MADAHGGVGRDAVAHLDAVTGLMETVNETIPQNAKTPAP